MSKFKLSKEFITEDTFRLELSNDEMNYLSLVLPARYSLQVEARKNIPKHALPVKKKQN